MAAEGAAIAAVVIEMPEQDRPSGQSRPAPSECAHDFQMDKDLEMWLCSKCGSALDLVTQVERHECGSDCDRHSDISAIG